MMHGHEKSDLVIVAMKPANKAKEAHCGGVCGGERSGVGGAHQHNTYWTQSQARVTNALERIRPLSPSHPRWEPYAGKPHVRFCAGGVR